MTIRRLSDVIAAFDEGRWHHQRIIKGSGVAHAAVWADWTFSSGQPAYDAHVGTPLTFTPCVAQRNQAVYFPPIPEGMERYLSSVTLGVTQSTFGGYGGAMVFDLIGYYPLIDGDSTDPQDMDNSTLMPRYADGKGVVAVMVNHVSPGAQNGLTTIEYLSTDDAPRSATVNIPMNGVGTVVTGHNPNAATSDQGAYALPLPGGVKAITRITHSVPPGGLYCIYLLQPLCTVAIGDQSMAVEKEFILRDGMRMPRILDGAWIGIMTRNALSAARTVSVFGNMTFIWG